MLNRTSGLEDRPLTESEKLFSEENYKLFLWYIRFYKLDQDESDALIIPYLTIVKKYLSIARLQQYKFATILVKQLNSYRQRYYRCMRSEKHMPEGGICSLDSPINKENEEEGDIGALVGKSLDIERNLVDQETFKEFTDIICKFPYGRQMKVVLCLLMEGYAEKEIIEYIQERFVCWEFDRKQLDSLMRQLRLAFREAGLDNNFMKVSLCNIVYYDILDYAIKEKIIKRQGAKLLYNDKVIGKGRDEGKRYLEEHQLEVSEIMDKIKSKYLCA